MGEPEAKRARTAAVAEPAELKCSITLELFRDPVSNCEGNTYERAAIEAHLAKPGAKRDPLTNEALANETLVSNQIVRRMVQAFLDAHPDYTPEGWENRMVPPLPGAVKSALAEVAAAKAANSVPRLLASLAALPNSVEVQVAGFDELWQLESEGDEEVKKQARESEAYGLVLAAMRNYRSNVRLQAEACWLLFFLYDNDPFSANGLASGADLVELVLAAAAAHAANADCADTVCGALASLLDHGEWACAAAEQGAAKAVVALMSAHADAEALQTNGIYALDRMVQHADWASVQAEAGDILAVAVRGLSAARVAGSFRQQNCMVTLSRLFEKDSSYAERIIAAGSFETTVKAMGADLNSNALQGNGCKLLHHLAETPSSSALPRVQLFLAQTAVVEAMDMHGEGKSVQVEGCLALTALQLLIRRRLCAVVEEARAKFPGAMNEETAATAIRSISDALATAEPASATAGAKAARELA